MTVHATPAVVHSTNSLLDTLIVTYKEYQRINSVLDDLKKRVRPFGPGKWERPTGTVEVSKGSPGGELKGTTLVLDADAFNELDASLKATLLATGVIRTENVYTRPSTPSVKVTPR